MIPRDQKVNSFAANLAQTKKSDLTFLTAIKSVNRTDNAESVFSQQIKEYYQKLTGKVTNLDSMIDTVLSKHEKEFMAAFKVHMHQVYSQLQELKKRTDAQEQQLKADAQMNRLQQSMDWFRDEAMKLKDQVAKLTMSVDKWKSKAITLEDDRKFLENQLKATRRENKLLKIALTKSKDIREDEEADAFHGANSYRRSTSQRQRLPPTSATFDTSLEMASHTFDLGHSYDNSKTSVNSKANSASFTNYLRFKYGVKNQLIFTEIEAYLANQEKKFQETLKHYKNTLGVERKKLRDFSSRRSDRIVQKNDLETLFLQCVDETKRDMVKRRSRSVQTQRTIPRKTTEFISSDKRKILELFVSNEQVLVMLYEMLFPHKASKLNEIIPRKFEPRPPSNPKPQSASPNLVEETPSDNKDLLEHSVNLK